MAMRPDVGMAGSSGYPTERFGPGGFERSKLQGTYGAVLRSHDRERGIKARAALGAPMSPREKDYVKAGVGDMSPDDGYSEARQRNDIYTKNSEDADEFERREKLIDVNKMYPQAQYSASPQMQYLKKQGPVSKAMGVVNTKPGMPPRVGIGKLPTPSEMRMQR